MRRTYILLIALAAVAGFAVGHWLSNGSSRTRSDHRATPDSPADASRSEDVARAVARIANYSFAKSLRPELARLVARLGPPQYSRHAEELVIRDFFGDRTGGVFLDVGASDYRQENNTFYLEEKLGWSGVAIDGQPRFAKGYLEHRPKTTFVAAFVSDEDGERLPFYVVKNDSLNTQSSGDRQLALRNGNFEEIEVESITLDTLLATLKIEQIDLLSMDIELWEPRALAGFDIDKYKPELVCIEAHEPVRYQIQAYFALHDYHLLGEYTRVDMRNWYFAPRRTILERRDREKMDVPLRR